MSETESERKRRLRLRWVTLGEAVAIAALILSGLGLWKDWRSDQERAPTGPTKVIEERKPIALKLHGRVEDEGKRLVISPIEDSHALDSLSVAIQGAASPISVGSDGVLDASDVQSAIGKPKDETKGSQRVGAIIDTRYVEAGQDRRSSSRYVISYHWEGGGLFGGRSLRLTGFSRG
jgi:hypothetical protein